jgi:hypothetical protein
MFGLAGRLATLEARVAVLEAMRAEWLDHRALLEDLHRRNLNTIRSLRKLARRPQDDDDDGAEGSDRSLRLDELTEARRRYGG